jgi:hypothetical protein
MSGRQGGVSGAPAGSVFNMVCPASRRPGCPLRTAALGAASARNGLKESLTECEIEIFLSLVRGQRVAVRDHETGALWRGWTRKRYGDSRIRNCGVPKTKHPATKKS